MEPDSTISGQERVLTVSEVLSILWRALAPVTLGVIGLYLLVWGWPAASPGMWVKASLWMLAAYIGAIVVHEALHILPMMLFGVRLRDLKFGIRWRDGVVFVHGGRPVSAWQYRVILALPGVVLGIAPVVYGLVVGHAFLTVFGYLMLVSAVGDWAVMRLIRDVPSDALVLDHPSEVGCIVL